MNILKCYKFTTPITIAIVILVVLWAVHVVSGAVVCWYEDGAIASSIHLNSMVVVIADYLAVRAISVSTSKGGNLSKSTVLSLRWASLHSYHRSLLF
jgi:hypothetical protein